MRTVKEVIKDIASTREVLKTNMEDVPFGQRPAMHMAITQAQGRIAGLTEEIKGICVPHRLVGLFAKGDVEAIQRTAQFIQEEDGVVVDAEALYRSVADLVEPSYGPNRIFDIAPQMALLVQKISEIGINLGYRAIEAPQYEEAFCVDYTATVTHVRKILRACGVGDQANIDLLTNQIIDTVVKEEIDSKQIPVLITGTSSLQEQNAIATIFAKHTTHTFRPDFEPTQKSIVALFSNNKEEPEE